MPREIGWSQESNLLYLLSKELDRLIQVLSQISPSAGGVPSTRTITINGVAQDLSVDRSWTIDTFYTADGALPGNRTIDLNGNSLILSGSTNFNQFIITDGVASLQTFINDLANSAVINAQGAAAIFFSVNINSTLGLIANGDVILSQGFTNMTGGFLHTPGAGGAPVAIPAATYPGQYPFYYDATGNRLYIYNGGWRSVALT